MCGDVEVQMLLSQASSRQESSAPTSTVGVWSRHGETAEERIPESAKW